MNCHPAGDVTLQGDDSHLHTISPQQGQDGHGVYAMKCANCHQPTNTHGSVLVFSMKRGNFAIGFIVSESQNHRGEKIK
jgi:hypothetical protein